MKDSTIGCPATDFSVALRLHSLAQLSIAGKAGSDGAVSPAESAPMHSAIKVSEVSGGDPQPAAPVFVALPALGIAAVQKQKRPPNAAVDQMIPGSIGIEDQGGTRQGHEGRLQQVMMPSD